VRLPFNDAEEVLFTHMSRFLDFENEGKHAFVSDNLVTLLPDISHMRHIFNRYGISDTDIQEKYKALLAWFKFLYYPPMKLKIDQWCLYAVLTKLRDSNIPYVFVQDCVGLPEVTWSKPVLDIDWKPDLPLNFKDPGYHTTPEQQVEIFDLIKCQLHKMNFTGFDT
jgi:hypothetical protein